MSELLPLGTGATELAVARLEEALIGWDARPVTNPELCGRLGHLIAVCARQLLTELEADRLAKNSR